MNRIMLVAFPLFIMLIASIINQSNIQTGTTLSFQTGNVTVNKETGSLKVEPINIPSLLTVAVIIGIALALCLVAGVKVFGSGVSGSVIPILFMVTILSSVFFLLSGLSYSLFESIPYIGMVIYFALIISYVIGIAGISVSSGGD